MQNKRKFLSWILAIVMMISLIPTTALAESVTVDDAVAQIDQDDSSYYQYESLAAAVNAAQAGDTIKLLKDVQGSVVIPTDKDITLDLNGKTITTSGTTVVNNGTLTVKDSSEPSTGKLVSTANFCIIAGSNSTTTFASGTIESVEGAIITGKSTGAAIYITGGTLNASDNAVVAGNGTKRDGEANTINISGGTLNGQITTAGYVACGVYAPWKDIVSITGGTINVDGGAGVVARAGSVTISGDVTITTTGNAETIGKVGDSRVVVPCSAVVYDSAANYPAMTEDSKIAVTGGTFTSADGVDAVTTVTKDSETNVRVAVTGGAFSTDVSDYIPKEMQAEKDEDGKYIVSVNPESAVAQVGEESFLTVQAAVNSISGTGTVTLKQDATEDAVTIPKGKTVTLDLNGKTLTSLVEVEGALTVQDTGTEGTVGTIAAPEGAESDTGVIDVEGASALFTLKSGKITANDDMYGVYALDGGTAVVNGGEIDTGYACLTGNNTTGDMNFTVTGGTLNAVYGPAIYMPGQVNLEISGGTLNGGISLRMGQIEISGGEINAVTSSIDSPTEYYNWSGNAWLPDALYVFGGTYGSENEQYGNSLDLNITGGTFTCENNQGSAVAIYDLGKIGQEMEVAISGDAKLTTNAEGRSAYQVLSLDDIGVTNPATGFGNEANTGKVATAISGGTFSTEVDEKYCAEGFQPVDNGNGNYGVKAETYTVTYEANGGSTVPSAQVEHGKVATQPDAPQREGYAFGGWYADEALTTAYDFATPVTGDITLYAKWTEEAVDVPETVRVTFQVSPEEAAATAEIEVVYWDAHLLKQPYYDLVPGSGYWYTVTANGYKSVSGDIDFSDAVDGNLVVNVTMEKASTMQVDFQVSPATVASTIVVTDAQGVAVPANKYGGYDLLVGDTYSYTITASGYKTATGTFTPSTADGGNLVTVTLVKQTTGGGSSGGGGSSSSSTTKTETVKNPDGSTTTTVTDAKTGTVTETVKTADGVTGTTVTDKNGDVTKVTASVPADVARDAAKTGETVTLPVEVPAVKDADDAPAVSVTVPKSSGAVKVEIPVEKVTSGTVAVLVKADGTEEIVKTSVTTEDGVALTVEGNTTVKVIDNSKRFADVHPVDHWATDSIDFVTSRELFTGKTSTTFAPNDSTTRAQLMTVLARLDGADTTGAALEKGMAWAVEKGISDGSNPGGTITRQQLAAMLYRYAGSPATDYELTHSDAHKVSDYAVDAMRWAVANGIITGKTDGTLDPHGLATRAQVAAMMARFCTKLG